MLDGVRSRIASAAPRTRLLLLLILIAVGSTHCAPMTWNDESRMATIQAVVESHTLVIDQTDFIATGDKVFVGGHFYSDKPPMPAFLGSIVYFPLYSMGLRLHEGASAAYLLITLLTVGLAWILGTLAIFEALQFTELDQESRFLASVTLGFGSTFMTWSTTFNNHELAAGSLAIGFLFFLRARFNPKALDVVCAGLFFSLAGACDIPTGIFYPLFLLCMCLDKTLRSKWLWYLAPLTVTALPTAVANYSIHHSVMPLQIYRAYFEYPGSPWLGSRDLSGMQTNDAAFMLPYALATLLGPMGFLLYNPFLIFAIWQSFKQSLTPSRFGLESACILTGSALLAIYYWVTTSNFGGWTYSIRWFVPLLPLFFFFLFPLFTGQTERQRKLYLVGLVASVVIGLVGALNPWSPLAYSSIPFVANIDQFVQHLLHPGGVYIKRHE